MQHKLCSRITFRRFVYKCATLLSFVAFSIGLFPGGVLAYPPYTANSDLVQVGPYDTAVSGTGNWGCGGSCLAVGGSREFITIGQNYRIRQSGTLAQVRLYITSTTNVTGFYIKIWRADGAHYDLVGTSNNLVGSLVAGSFNTLQLSSPITGVREGDYYGYRVEVNSSAYQMYAKLGVSGTTSYFLDNATPSTTDYNWTAQTNIPGAVVPIELYMQAPQSAFIGDSIIAGHPTHYSFLETSSTTNIASTIENQFGGLTGYTYQNMGVGSQTTAGISGRFTNDIVNLAPRIVAIEGGVNDIAGSVSKSTFLANWTSMLNAAQASSKITTIVVLKILPWTNGTNTQMQTRDDWNNSLGALASGYSKAIVVDASSYVGQFRAGGDEGNLWNIKAAYNQDGVHFNQAGHGQIAQAIADALPQPPTISSVTTTAENGAYRVATEIPITVNFSHAVTSTGNVTVTLNTTPSRSCTFTVSNQTSGTCTYTVQAGDTATTLNATISGSIADNPGNAMTNFTPTSNLSASKTINIDTTNPTVAEVTPVPAKVETDTPTYTFSSTEAGTISYGGECSSATTVATVGENIITFNSLRNGTHSNCTIVVADTAGNNSNTLSVTSFTTNISLGGGLSYIQSSNANANGSDGDTGNVVEGSGESPSAGPSDTNLSSQLQDQIQALTSQINALLAQNGSSPARILTEPLFYGAKGDQVVLLQSILKQQGFFSSQVNSNGKFGPTTLKAVQAFQVKYNIAAIGTRGYGLVGPTTRAALNQLVR